MPGSHHTKDKAQVPKNALDELVVSGLLEKPFRIAEAPALLSIKRSALLIPRAPAALRARVAARTSLTKMNWFGLSTLGNMVGEENVFDPVVRG